ncbi:MAG: hypothetical protein COW73_07195 [Nitrospirae bacterium CG18_big_fil_WC_8_21_14_2_50_70_55]|nr:MAG: hypothetical protein AUK30_04515 [Nitrospirae bacterium CG2_30_70_394]PIQ04755.1 MAG: hypothetical protein COW73_07195 [Nitrospirae bacterium CG18_big_fil_WC_8_21_14_2_50_70_55]PIU78195.1 MAG: hypothetical protein COS73_07785 [Nitrospirae bacterium CG06_land_8_20_14_3_00_70_43]PIW82200.1 MAG: hypothetical protein COZ96_09735 [Nitrospirae bacterium CG_4_8_14_3_um_filter_70_85]PIX83230.1 MAG: hypothetical protein COZ33_06380 [Nitrospirae bacterium CG_4_10_14_3_um_filter_70_108]PJB94813.1
MDFVNGHPQPCDGQTGDAATRDYLVLFWTRLDDAERRWHPPVPLVALAPRRTLSGLYLSSAGESGYRCRVVPGVVRHDKRLAVLLGAALSAGATQVSVGVAKPRRGVGRFEISVTHGHQRCLAVGGRLHALPARLAIPLTFLQWKPSGALVALPECAQEVAWGRPHLEARPPVTDLPFGAPFVVVGWGSSRVASEAEGRLPVPLRISIEGIHRVAGPASACRVS